MKDSPTEGDEGPPLSRFAAPYAGDDAALVRGFIESTRGDKATDARVEARARAYIGAIREAEGSFGGLDDFLREYALSTREGLALMVLAEALLRVPDAATQDRLIEDRLAGRQWDHGHSGESWFVSASTWALGLSTRIVAPGEDPDSILSGLMQRIGQPAVRLATRQAIRLLGHHFVLGETIGEALHRARDEVRLGYRHSFDMLGEGARTAADAARYFEAYAEAIEAIAASAGERQGPDRPGISVKLSALHPRYEAAKDARIRAELAPRVLELARAARAHDLLFTVDAEEADRLEISLDVIGRVVADRSLAGWDGFGLAVQAYQKRAGAVIDWVADLAAVLGRRFAVRLVKGAYWDTEIKRAQERGLADYPVFTRKPATDLSYLAGARKLLAARGRIWPQFATHNALTVAALVELAGGERSYEFQRLHGMGEALYEAVRQRGDAPPCRIYAPVGGYRDLLAYLVRRLLENGANSSFVALASDPDVPVESLTRRPADLIGDPAGARHARIVPPADIFRPQRANSRGIEFGERAAREALASAVATDTAEHKARPLALGLDMPAKERAVRSPYDGSVVGHVAELPPAAAAPLVAIARQGFAEWSARPAEARAAILEKTADLLEAERDTFIALIAREGGRTLVDGLSELREAADFCRYYAAEARRHFAVRDLPGPTGEANRWRLRPRGVFLAIAPWNFPLAIFLGQTVAALAAGNAVIAKPAEQTPLVAARAIQLLHRAGVPERAVLLAPGDGGLGAALVARPDIDGVVFTGSTETAWAINRALAAREAPIVPLIAETGGINAMIVDATALPEQVTDDVMVSAFRSAGQRCSALRILFLQDDVADGMLNMLAGAAAELALGDPRDPATDIGPVIERSVRDALLAHIEAMKASERLRFAGEVPSSLPAEGHFVAPHIVELNDAAALTREVFGPVLHVARWRADRLDDVLAWVRRSGYGLTLGIHSRIEARARRIADALPVGNVYVNHSIIGAVVGSQPFGGSGLSGTGPKAGGPLYLPRFAEEQVIADNMAAVGGNASLVAMEDEGSGAG